MKQCRASLPPEVAALVPHPGTQCCLPVRCSWCQSEQPPRPEGHPESSPSEWTRPSASTLQCHWNWSWHPSRVLGKEGMRRKEREGGSHTWVLTDQTCTCTCTVYHATIGVMLEWYHGIGTCTCTCTVLCCQDTCIPQQYIMPVMVAPWVIFLWVRIVCARCSRDVWKR